MLNAAWDRDTPIARENSLPCHDRVAYNKMLESVKFPNDPDRRHLSSFAYSRLIPALMEGHNIVEFERFVKKLHGNYIQIPSIHQSLFSLFKVSEVVIFSLVSLSLCYRGSCNESSPRDLEFCLSNKRKGSAEKFTVNVVNSSSLAYFM